jgi:hypothetical protein
MIMRTLFFLLLFFWGILWTGADGLRAAPTDPTHGPRSVYLEWNEPGGSGRQIFNEMRKTDDPTITPFLRPGFRQVIQSKGSYTLLDEGENPVSDASQKERSEPQRDWKGIGRDTAYFMGYQVVIAGALWVLPESVTKWTDEQKRATVNKWAENVQSATWDKDPAWINYIGHPYWGATYYIRARERGFGEFGSFWYSAFLSALYEYGIEAFFEQPSYQDLIVTPVGGALIGKFIFEPIRASIKSKTELTWSDHLILILTDPLGAANGLVDRSLGVKSNVRVAIPGLTPPLRIDHSSYHAAGSLKRHNEDNAFQQGFGIGFDLTW